MHYARCCSMILLSFQFWPMPSMSRGVINCAKQFLSHPFSRIKSFDQWAVDRDPVLTSTTSAKIGKTAIWQDSSGTHICKRAVLSAKCKQKHLERRATTRIVPVWLATTRPRSVSETDDWPSG